MVAVFASAFIPGLSVFKEGSKIPHRGKLSLASDFKLSLGTLLWSRLPAACAVYRFFCSFCSLVFAVLGVEPTAFPLDRAQLFVLVETGWH